MKNPIKYFRSALAVFLCASALIASPVISGCGGPSQAEKDFYSAFNARVTETQEALLEEADMLSDSQNYVLPEFCEVYPGGEAITPDKEKRPSQEEISLTAAKFDKAIAALAAGIEMPVPPAECAACSDRNQAVLDVRSQAVTSIKQAKEAFLLGAQFKTLRTAEVRDINTVTVPSLLDDVSQATNLYADIKVRYEKHAASYQAVTVPPALLEPLSRLVTQTKGMADFSQSCIDAYNNWNNDAMDAAYKRSATVSFDELTAFNNIMQSLNTEISNRIGDLNRGKIDLAELLKQFPQEVRSTT